MKKPPKELMDVIGFLRDEFGRHPDIHSSVWVKAFLIIMGESYIKSGIPYEELEQSIMEWLMKCRSIYKEAGGVIGEMDR